MSATNSLKKAFGNTRAINAATRSAAPASKLLSFKNKSNISYWIDELTNKWLNRLRATANNNESREQHAQLASILDYYNKTSTGTKGMAAIDWDTYEKSIHTPGVVGKI